MKYTTKVLIVLFVCYCSLATGCNEAVDGTITQQLDAAAAPKLAVSVGEVSDQSIILEVPDEPGSVELNIEASGIEFDNTTRAAVEVLSASALSELPDEPHLVPLVKSGNTAQPFVHQAWHALVSHDSVRYNHADDYHAQGSTRARGCRTNVVWGRKLEHLRGR